MPKSVKLSTGLEFKSISQGSEHFRKLLQEQELNLPFTGEDEAHIRAAYDAYCAKTDWRVPSRPASFCPTQDQGPGYTTRCYGVTFEDGSTGNFSMPKALSSIAS